LPLRLIRN